MRSASIIFLHDICFQVILRFSAANGSAGDRVGMLKLPTSRPGDSVATARQDCRLATVLRACVAAGTKSASFSEKNKGARREAGASSSLTSRPRAAA